MYIIRINVIRIFEQFEIQIEARFFLEPRKALERFKSSNYFNLFMHVLNICYVENYMNKKIKYDKHLYIFLNEVIIN